MVEKDEQIRAQFNNETAKITWKELEPHFARGALIHVAMNLDLIDVAVYVKKDDTASIAAWMESGEIQRVTIKDAQIWNDQNSNFWAVVAAPWVLIQEIQPEKSKQH